MKKSGLVNRMKRQAKFQENNLLNDTSVLWVEQQRTMRRVKRSDFSEIINDDDNDNSTASLKRDLFDLTRHFTFSFGFNQNMVRHKFNDELWPSQWYIHSSGFSRFDHGITKVWEMGYTGKGIVVTILDDGKFHQ